MPREGHSRGLSQEELRDLDLRILDYISRHMDDTPESLPIMADIANAVPVRSAAGEITILEKALKRLVDKGLLVSTRRGHALAGKGRY